jgi:N-acetylglucosamine kinase-like BadF-type ATPase
VLAHYHLTRPQDLVHAIYHGGSHPAAMAALAREVEAAAIDEDAVALRILAIGALELADAAASVARRLELDRTACRLVLAGRILRMLEHLRARLMERLAERLPLATPEVLAVEPASGAVRLALAAARDRLDLPVYLDAGAA